MSAEEVHHRLVLAIEASATSSSAFSAFREIALERLITQLALVSFEVSFHLLFLSILLCASAFVASLQHWRRNDHI